MTTTSAEPAEVPSWGQAPLFDVPDRARLRTVREVAELAHVHRNVVYGAINAGALTASRPGGRWRVALTDAERWIRSTETTTTEPVPGVPATDTPETGRKDDR